MRTFMATIILASCLAFSSSVLLSNATAVDLIRLTEQNYDQLVPKGKEVDAIYGDWVLRNKYVVAVIANPTPGRKANMTVRGVGGMIIDYSTRYSSSDQLSCFYPAAGRFIFENKDKFWLRIGEDNRTALGETESLSTQSINLEIEGRAVSGDGTIATVVYSLSEDQPWLEYTVEIRNAGKDSRRIAIEDSMRCDGNLFAKGTLAEGRLFYAEDRYFGQCYGVQHSDGTLTAGTSRNIVLRSSATPDSAVVAGESVRWNGFLFCAHGVPGIRAKASLATSEVELQEVILNLKNAMDLSHMPGWNSLGLERYSVRCKRLKKGSGERGYRLQIMKSSFEPKVTSHVNIVLQLKIRPW